VDGAFPVLEQRAALNGSPRLEPHNGDSGVLPQIHLAVLPNGFLRGNPQLFGDVVEIFGIQEDILPVDAAFSALVAVKAETVLCADAHIIEVFGDVL